jgi:hypothetical protein
MSGSDVETVTVNSTTDWTLQVDSHGVVSAVENPDPYERADGWTTRGKEWAPKGRTHRYGLTIEKVLARYAHETRFERGSNEHGAVLRDGIIETLCDLNVRHTCSRDECDEQVVHIRHVNAPTGPETSLVCDEHAMPATYVTHHALNAPRQQVSQ